MERTVVVLFTTECHSTSTLQATFTHLYMEHLAHAYFNMWTVELPFLSVEIKFNSTVYPYEHIGDNLSEF